MLSTNIAKYFLMLLLLLFTFAAIGQSDLLIKKNNRYHYKGKSYKCKELGLVYKDNKDALSKHKSGRLACKFANFSTFAGLGMIGFGAIIINNAKSFNKKIPGYAFISIGVALELLGLIPRFIGKNKLKKAFQIFNFDEIEQNGYKSEVSLSIQETRNGIGFVLQF